MFRVLIGHEQEIDLQPRKHMEISSLPLASFCVAHVGNRPGRAQDLRGSG